MLAIGGLILWGGYALYSYGIILVRGYDIRLREWVSPLNSFQWPASGEPPTVPSGQLWPSGTAGQSSGQGAQGVSVTSQVGSGGPAPRSPLAGITFPTITPGG